ncbi:MAG: RimK family alpha-L-glutamate ligase [Halanaeroarchaeum sp.]
MRPHDPIRTGIVTGEGAPALTNDGKRLRAALEDRGHSVEPVRWDEPSVDWGEYDCLIVRSCWQYHAAEEAFRDWIDAVDRSAARVLNAPEVLRWNVHKYYLQDLERASVPVIPTEYVDRGSTVALATVLERTGWTDAVVKPAVGTSSHDVWRVRSPVSPAAADRFRDQLAETDVLVQRFVPAIVRGELSVVFFGGEFSHAYRSVPATDGFRAHPEFGGSIEPEPDVAAPVDEARTVLAAASDHLSIDVTEFAYARVDGVERAGEFELMELELIEPYLGLATSEGAVDRFADAIATAVRGGTDASHVGGR